MHSMCYTTLKTCMPKSSHMLSTAISLLMNTILCVICAIKLYLLYIHTHIKNIMENGEKGKRTENSSSLTYL